MWKGRQLCRDLLSTAFATRLLPYILLVGVAELLLVLWSVVIGVNTQRWKEQADAEEVVS